MGRSVTGSVGRRRCCSPSLSCHAMSIAHEITDLRPTSSSLPPPPPPPPPHTSLPSVSMTQGPPSIDAVPPRLGWGTIDYVGLHDRDRDGSANGVPVPPPCRWPRHPPTNIPLPPPPPRLVWDHCTTQGQEPAAVCSEPASQSVFAGADGGKPPPPPPARQRLIGCYAHVGSTSGDLHRQ